MEDAPLYRVTNRFTNVEEEELYQEHVVEQNAPRARTAAFVCSAIFLVIRAVEWGMYFSSAMQKRAVVPGKETGAKGGAAAVSPSPMPHHTSSSSSITQFLIPDLGWLFGFFCGFLLLSSRLRKNFQIIISAWMVLFAFSFVFTSKAGGADVVSSNVLLGFVIMAGAMPMLFRLDFVHSAMTCMMHTFIFGTSLFVNGMSHSSGTTRIARIGIYLIAVGIALVGAHQIDRYQRQQFLFCHYYGQTVRLLSYDGTAQTGSGGAHESVHVRDKWAPSGFASGAAAVTALGSCRTWGHKTTLTLCSIYYYDHSYYSSAALLMAAATEYGLTVGLGQQI